jgi:7,8-dihydropterin-6-yl-methyl-4-(beta-D-ribofuranosyl)aminobenzene 5'-phosphate synthase
VLACDSLSVTVLVDNYIDMLLGNEPGLSRQGMPEHFDPRRGTPLAENGISFVARATTAGRTTTILFDAGMSPIPLVHNARVLGLDLSDIDHVVLSHGHPDHFGGVYAALEAIGRPVPVTVHPSAFRPRHIARPDVVMSYFNRHLTESAIERAGGRIVPVRDPIAIAPGVTTSGVIPTAEAFEEEVPGGRFCVEVGRVIEDPIEDYLTLVINVRHLGLVVLDPCGHSGVISSLLHARTLAGVDTVHALMGGFHLGHAGITQEKIDRTVERLGELDVRHISPMHCSGFRAQRAVAERLPDRMRLMTVGTVVTFGSET